MQKHFNFINDDIVQAAVALAGGGGEATFGSCGVFSGGLMALSIKFSPRSDELSEKEIEEFKKISSNFYEFRDWFVAEFGGVTCREVQCGLFGRFYNLMNDEESQAKRKEVKSCAPVSVKSALKVAEILSR